MSAPHLLTDDREAAWRSEVGLFRRSHPQRVFPMLVAVGVPGGPRVAVEVPWPEPRDFDDGLRFDVSVALLVRWRLEGTLERAASAWFSRVGIPHLHDADLAWHAAVLRASSAEAVPLERVRVVTKHGWTDVASGEERLWKRLRLRPSAPTA